MWQLQDHPGAPGTARQESTPTIVSTNDGGIATQPRAPGHGRPLTAQPAVRPDRPCAAPRGPVPDRSRLAQRAPDQHVPRATTARAPGADRPRAAPLAPGPRRPRHAQMAPGPDRPPVPPSAVPGQDRPRAAPLAPGPCRPRHAQMAPGADLPLATTAGAPGPHRPCAGTAVPRATASLPAGRRWLRQVILPRVPATPNTLIAAYPHSRSIASSSHHPAPPRSAGRRSLPSPGACAGGGLGRGPLPTYSQSRRTTTSQVHPATQVPPCPRSCSTAGTGLLHRHPARAPPSYTPTGNLTWSGHPLPGASARGGRGRGPLPARGKTYPC